MAANMDITGHVAGSSTKAEGPHSAFLSDQALHPVLQQLQELKQTFAGT